MRAMLILPRSLLEDLSGRAKAAPRRRAHHTLHAGDADRVQRFFVAAQPDSYFRPHRHRSRSELVLVLRGSFDVLTFDADGVVTYASPNAQSACHRLGIAQEITGQNLAKTLSRLSQKTGASNDALIAVAGALLLSPLAPIGPLRRLEPHPGMAFDTTVLVGGAIVIGSGLYLIGRERARS